jgi:hypothetical protein
MRDRIEPQRSHFDQIARPPGLAAQQGPHPRQ